MRSRSVAGVGRRLVSLVGPHPSPIFAYEVARRTVARPSEHLALARAIAQEDASALGGLLAALGVDHTAAAVTRLLDDPGPFLPCCVGWT